MKRIKPTIENFLEEFTWDTREIIDNITGQIFQEFPNIKEKVSNSKIQYKDAEQGNFLELKVLNSIVILSHLKNKTTREFKTVSDVDLEKIKLFFQKEK
ncbi:MAG: hypothetical protein HRU03_01130 [Nanoarchaeales archaeon]|nr:hypothetical protein [Nanoarchaeales archaeon]